LATNLAKPEGFAAALDAADAALGAFDANIERCRKLVTFDYARWYSASTCANGCSRAGSKSSKATSVSDR
jgi:hypothetical protein